MTRRDSEHVIRSVVPTPRERDFRFSIISDLRPTPGTSDWRRHYAQFVTEAALADALGYRGLRLPESHGHADGMLASPLTLLAGVASVTKQLRLTTYILPLPLYRWRRVIEDATIVDLVSGGRLELGVGAGARRAQFDLFSADISRRGRLTEEAIIFIREGLARGVIPDGRSGSLVPVTPRPVQDSIPLLVGGMAEAAVDRAVRLGDGCLAYDYRDPEKCLPEFFRTRLAPALERHDTSSADFRFSASIVLWVADDPERDWELLIKPAFTYRQGRYHAWSRRNPQIDGMTAEVGIRNVIIDTPRKPPAGWLRPGSPLRGTSWHSGTACPEYLMPMQWSTWSESPATSPRSFGQKLQSDRVRPHRGRVRPCHASVPPSGARGAIQPVNRRCGARCRFLI